MRLSEGYNVYEDFSIGIVSTWDTDVKYKQDLYLGLVCAS